MSDSTDMKSVSRVPAPVERAAKRMHLKPPAKRDIRDRHERICRAVLVIVDLLSVGLALLGGYYLRFAVVPQLVPKGTPFIGQSILSLEEYLPRIALGAGLFIFLLLAFGAYRSAALLRFRKSFPVIVKALFVWIVLYAGLALFLEIDEELSRLFLAGSFIALFVIVLVSRFMAQRILSGLGLTAAFRQRLLFVDWTERSAAIAGVTSRDPWHPYELVGCAPPARNHFIKQPAGDIPTLGSHKEVSVLCENGLLDIIVLADGHHKEEDVLALAKLCEMNHVDFMVIPSGFQILLSGLELTTVSGVPLLGVTKLPLDNPVNSALKRFVDIVGAIVGLIVSIPLIIVFGILVYLESPGPILYRQRRVGRKGRHFDIIKIRSMKLDAEAASGPRWAVHNDDRRLRVGTLMRSTNIDEIPQFWNVLVGDLSLVGPRPERPELIVKFREEIPSYNARHNIIPGMTGWAQVNGLRGDCDLSERIRFDLYYIENWSIVLDLQIMAMTFFRLRNAH